jgi:hypothetical protein
MGALDTCIQIPIHVSPMLQVNCPTLLDVGLTLPLPSLNADPYPP